MGFLGFFWDMYQQGQIQETRAQVNRAQTDSARTVRDLEARLDSLTLTTMAMWSLLHERMGVDENALAARVRELDLKDGRLDGRYSAPPATCAECGRTFAGRRERCIYCGGPPRAA